MSQSTEGLAQKLAELRRSFDESFAAPLRTEASDQEDLLAIELENSRFAVRVGELAGVHACRKIVPLPGALPGLLGVVGIRGRLVVAYRLANFVGAASEPSPSMERLRWLLVCRGDSQVGLAVEGLDGYLRVSRSFMHPVPEGEGAGEHVREVLRADNRDSSVLSVRSILDAIVRRAKVFPQRK